MNIQVTERVTHLKSRFVEGLKAEERQEEEIQKAIIAQSLALKWCGQCQYDYLSSVSMIY